MAIGNLADIAAKVAPTVGAGVGALVSRVAGNRRRRELEESLGGQMQKRAQSRAAERDITGDYGMSEAEKRKQTAAATEAGREAIGQQRRDMLRSIVASGGLGRSGAAIEAEKGLGQQQAALNVGAAQAVQQASQARALEERATDRQVGEVALLAKAAEQKEKQEELQKGLQAGYKAGTALADAFKGSNLKTAVSALKG